MDHSEFEYVFDSLCSALRDLIKHDSHLLSTRCSERSVTHKLAVHLSKHFPDHDVDCEYNRTGDAPKSLQSSHFPGKVSTRAIDAVTVFPDIIVHKRGPSGPNLLVIEVKKASSTESAEYDKQKLVAFKMDLNYLHAVHVVIGYDQQEKLVCTQCWQ